ncbi:MAG: hypothetical protein PUD95_08485 [Succinatimonas sp.]|nr:hypothetical protein [Succinatimonas sp.]
MIKGSANSLSITASTASEANLLFLQSAIILSYQVSMVSCERIMIEHPLALHESKSSFRQVISLELHTIF